MAKMMPQRTTAPATPWARVRDAELVGGERRRLGEQCVHVADTIDAAASSPSTVAARASRRSGGAHHARRPPGRRRRRSAPSARAGRTAKPNHGMASWYVVLLDGGSPASTHRAPVCRGTGPRRGERAVHRRRSRGRCPRGASSRPRRGSASGSPAGHVARIVAMVRPYWQPVDRIVVRAGSAAVRAPSGSAEPRTPCSKLMAARHHGRGPYALTNVPDIADVRIMSDLLAALGLQVELVGATASTTAACTARLPAHRAAARRAHRGPLRAGRAHPGVDRGARAPCSAAAARPGCRCRAATTSAPAPSTCT